MEWILGYIIAGLIIVAIIGGVTAYVGEDMTTGEAAVIGLTWPLQIASVVGMIVGKWLRGI